MVESAEQWESSSYRITAGLESSPGWFDQEWILGCFSKNDKKAVKGYMQFVADGMQQPSSWLMLKNQIYLGSDKFIEKVQNKVSKKGLAEIPKIQKRPVPKSLEEYELQANNRNEAIILAYRSGGYTLTVIGRYFSLHYSTVSRIVHSGMQN